MLENYDYILSIDIETYSPEELTTCGVYKYAAHPDARILWLACELYDLKTKTRHPVAKVDLLKYAFPEPIKAHLLNPRVAKFAWNANFERTFLAARLGIPVGPEHWFCTMVLAARAGYPMSLDAAAKARGVVNQKSGTGRALINYFCKPCAPTKVNNGRTRNLPDDAPVKWEEFGEYCAQDVRAESDIRDSLLVIPVSEFETKLWHLDQKINDRGVRVDVDFIINAIRIHKEYVDDLKIEAFNITGLDNPNSRDQLIQWLRDNEVEVETLRKADVATLIKQVHDGDVKRMLEIRSEVNKTSVKKYQAMLNSVREDGRVRGTLQFYGASKTGRWAGRILQTQNLPQNQLLIDKKEGIDDLDVARKLVEAGDGVSLEMLYGNVPDTLSQLIRTAIIPEQGHRFLISDYAAIEARVLAWLAGEQWRIDLFDEGIRDIYIESIARALGIPYESIDKKTPEGHRLRQLGKILELASGFQGGFGAYVRFGALEKGLTEDQIKEMVTAWRVNNLYIFTFWYAMENAAKLAIQQPGVRVPVTQEYPVFNDWWHPGFPVKHFQRHNPLINFKMIGRTLYMFLPSGRMLSYVNARLAPSPRGGNSQVITFEGMDQVTKRWCQQDTYGGRLVENATQAVARDCLAYAMMNLDAAGYQIVMSVHDEVVLEVPYGQGSIDDVNRIMGMVPDWATGLPLKAESFETNYYKKE